MSSVLYTPNSKEIITGETFTGADGKKRNALDVKVYVDPADPLPISGTITASQGPTQFLKDGTAVEVAEDTVTPANTVALPVRVINEASAGGATEATLANVEAYTQSAADTLEDLKLVDYATEATLSDVATKLPNSLGAKASAASLAVVLATDQAALPLPTGAATAANQTTANISLAAIQAKDFATEATLAAASAKLPASLGTKNAAQSFSVVLASDQPAISVNSGGGFTNGSQITQTISAATSFTPPGNAKGFILQAADTNTSTLRFKVGAGQTAAANSGMQLQPGRDSGFLGVAANISVCPESGSGEVQLQWVLSV